MSKKIIPILTLLGASALIVGVSISPIEEKKEAYITNINSFQTDVADYVSATSNITSNALNKYALALKAENFSDKNYKVDNTIKVEDSTNKIYDEQNISNEPSLTVADDVQENNTNNETTDAIQDNFDDVVDDDTQKILEEHNIDEDVEEISTIYSLSNDIEESCNEFCELKQNIVDAIIETQNLIKRVQDKEIELNNEQRLFLIEQTQQLKNLGRQLSSVTTELSFNLSDINQIMTTNSQDIDKLSLKYLIVLDNLVNGNEMLQSGLSSLNLINQIVNMNSKNIPSNNHGRILYGFQQNNNEPIIKDFYIDNNGNMVENNQNNTNNDNESLEENSEIEVANEKETNIDTYKNSKLTTNIDTYNNSNVNHNIDTFFNTALLDNEFMYGNNQYGMNAMYGNPYLQNYANYAQNTSNSVHSNQITQNNESNNNAQQKEKKKFKLKKNIDTFKDENEPDIKTKLGNIKNSISSFFSKFKKSDLDDKIDNPVYRYKVTDEN